MPSARRLEFPLLRHLVLPVLVAAGAGVALAQGETRVVVRPEVVRAPLGAAVDVRIEVENADNLGAFEIKFGFPPGLAAYESIQVGPFIGQTGRTVRALPPVIESGLVRYAVVTERGAPGASGSGVLATVRLIPLDRGEGLLTLSDVLLADADNGNRTQPTVVGGRIEIGPIGTPSPTAVPTPTGIFIALPMAFKGVGIESLPTAAPPVPTPISPTAPPPSPTVATPTAQATIATAAATPAVTATPTPTATPDKPDPKIGGLQCRTTSEWVSIVNQGGQALDLDGWMMFSTTGIQTYTFQDPYILNPGDSVYLHTGPQAPRTEGNRIRWTLNYIWNEVDGDTAQLKSPRPNSVIIDTKDCE